MFYTSNHTGSEWASGPAVTPAYGSLPARVEPLSAPGHFVCVCGGVRTRYDAFRNYSGSLVYIESGQHRRPEILHDFLVIWVL